MGARIYLYICFAVVRYLLLAPEQPATIAAMHHLVAEARLLQHAGRNRNSAGATHIAIQFRHCTPASPDSELAVG